MDKQKLIQWLNKPIEEKSKTGDQEQIGLLWAAAAAFDRYLKRDNDALQTDTDVTLALDHDSMLQLRKVFARAASSSFTEKNSSIPQQVQIQSDFDNNLHTYWSLWEKDSYKPALANLLWLMVKKLNTTLVNQTAFVTNLVMLDYRTTHGSRLRKETNTLKKPHNIDEVDEYFRPFECAFPAYNGFLLSAVSTFVPPTTNSDEDPCSPLDAAPDVGYVAPTRFTASFPKSYDEVRKTFVRVGNKGLDQSYAFLGSFGFSEPGYCCWEAGDTSEYDGTRLSLGAYSLNPQFLAGLLGMLRGMDKKTADNYAKYGGVSMAHVQQLNALFSQKSNGYKLTTDWVADMCLVSDKLVEAAGTAINQQGTTAFTAFIRDKIQKRLDKVDEVRKPVPVGLTRTKLTDDSMLLFDKLWVLESTLWEYALIGASGLSLQNLKASLLDVDGGWQPSLFVSDSADTVADSWLQDKVLCNEMLMTRTLFPSGSAAAVTLNKVLKDSCNIPELKVKVDRNALSTFTPYFEFYQQDTSILNPKSSQVSKSDVVQFWVNLSDDLHGKLLDIKQNAVAAQLADWLVGYVTQVQTATDKELAFNKVVLVIDFTKFSSDFPGQVVYPMLLELSQILTEGHDDLVQSVVLLRSNLKYNTGSIDRYQSGEVLVSGDSNSTLNQSLQQAASNSFTSDEQDYAPWSMQNHYIPLMKRLYLLADFILYRRWQVYVTLYTSPDPRHTESHIRRSQVDYFYRYRLEILFSNLSKDIGRSAWKGVVNKELIQKVKQFWTEVKTSLDKQAKLNPMSQREIDAEVNKFIGLIRTELPQIKSGLSSINVRQVHDKQAKMLLSSYRSRVGSVVQKLDELPE